MYACMHVCMYVCMYVYSYIYIYIYIYMYIYIYVFTVLHIDKYGSRVQGLGFLLPCYEPFTFCLLFVGVGRGGKRQRVQVLVATSGQGKRASNSDIRVPG